MFKALTIFSYTVLSVFVIALTYVIFSNDDTMLNIILVSIIDLWWIYVSIHVKGIYHSG